MTHTQADLQRQSQLQSQGSSLEEKLSALADGELGNAECADVFRQLGQQPAVALQWDTYHLIGDTLRSGLAGADVQDAARLRVADSEFMKRLSQRLTQEKVAAFDPAFAQPVAAPVVSPQSAGADYGATVGTVNPLLIKDAANDGNLRWKLLAGFACMSTAAILTWNAVGSNALNNEAQLAQSAPGGSQLQVTVASPQGAVIRDARLEELLAAHKQMGGTSLPVPSGFLRNANFENQPRNAR